MASSVPFNVGEISIQGLEFALNATPYSSDIATIDLGIIASYTTNDVKSVGVDEAGNPLPDLFDGFDVNVIKPGLPRSAFFVTPVNGATFNEAGVYTGVDTGVQVDDAGNALDSNCNVEDNRCFLGIPYPKYNGSFTANLTLFQDFTVYALADWATGLSVYNNTDRFRSQFGNYVQRNELADQLGIGATDDLPNLTPGSQEYIDAANAYAKTDRRFPTNFVRDADYIKLREVSVRYNLGRILAQTPGLDRVRTASLAFSARNVFQSSLYDGLDPEVNFNGARSLSRGSDFLTLQNPRQYYLTLSLGI